MLIIVRLVYLNLVSLTKVKCLVYCEMSECTYIQFHSVEEPSKNHIWFGFGFSSIRGKIFLFGSFLLDSGSFPSLIITSRFCKLDSAQLVFLVRYESTVERGPVYDVHFAETFL